MVIVAKRSEGERIHRCAFEGNKNIALGLNEISERIRCCRGPGIVTVTRDMSAIGCLHRCPRLRANAGIVVTRELLQNICAFDLSHIISSYFKPSGPKEIQNCVVASK